MLTPLQSSECDLERIHNDETVSSDVVEEPESLEYPTFLAIDIGDSRPSDEDIRTFLKSLATFTQDTLHIAPPVLDRIITILEQLQHRISSYDLWQKNPIFLFPCLDQVTNLSSFSTWAWHILLSSHNTRLSVAVLDVLRKELRYISHKSMINALRSGFIPSLLSALGVESLLSLPLSDPLPDALYHFLIGLIDNLKWRSLSEVASSSRAFTSQLLDHLLHPLRSLLIFHLNSPTSISNCMHDRFWHHRLYKFSILFDEVPPNNQLLPILNFFRHFAYRQHGQNDFVAFVTGLMQEVWEERRREGLVGDEPVPLFVSTPLRTNMTPPEMVPLLDSASAFLASTDPLSDSHAITVTLFLMCFNNVVFIKKGDSTHPITFLHLKSLSSCPPFATSLAKLMLLSSACSHFEIREENRFFWTKLFPTKQRQLQDIVTFGFIAVLADVAQTLRTGWSDDILHRVHCFFTDIIELSVRMITPCRSTPETDSDIEHFHHDQQIIVNHVLVPLRQSLVHCIKTNTRIVPHFDILSYPDINHPSMVRFFAGVWEEVRREAIEIVCGEDEAEAPVYLTMDLFSRLSMEETELGLSSLSSYLSSTPSPPPPVASSIHLFLLTIATASSHSFSERKKIRARSVWTRIGSQLKVWIRSHRSFAICFAETVPTLLLTNNFDIRHDMRWMIEDVLRSSYNSSESVPSLAEAGLVSNMALVLMKAQNQSNIRYTLKHPYSRFFLTVVKKCLDTIPSSSHLSIEGQLNDNEHNTRILIEKVLVPSQPFLTSLLAPLSMSRCVDEAISDLKQLLETIGKVEWYYPQLTKSLARCGFHVATMRFCDLTEINEHQIMLLTLLWPETINSKIINRNQSSSKTDNSASSKLTIPTQRERMNGRNEEGQEDLVEKVMICRVLLDNSRDIQSRTNRFINKIGFNTFR
ncbi:hypothetical protein BLNAU_8392 [Blattamonas nauphoetae]|uniref:Uncharacterized protein n=1 Tax=Blattamonas nauphoetae TaxID=2049346 RepID=A0ABQ9XYI5_9EUKA|nr:hypothetical protein BLNAU_8392 [Blattamonas nauphoetae]